MSRSRCRVSLDCLRRRKAPRSGYINVDEEDSDVPMACGDELGDHRITASLLAGRLHIQDVSKAYIKTYFHYSLSYPQEPSNASIA